MRRRLAIPPEPLGRFVLGEITIRELGRLCGANQDRVSRALRALGVDTSSGAHKRRRVARGAEAAAQLPAGSAYETAAQAYRQGAALRDVAAKLGCDKKAAGQFLRRLEEAVRPDWCREVFRDPDGRHLDLTPFAETLRAMRQSRGWSQARLGAACGLCQGTIWHLEAARKGPKWDTLDKLTRGLGVRREDLGVTWGPLP
jgi:DNA-binding XRE family transcriptional regulator